MNYDRNSKVILTDADGVCLNWTYAFCCWMEQNAYTQIANGSHEYNIAKRFSITPDEAVAKIKVFNESAAICFLPALRDAVYYVKRLHEEHGYVFRCITSLSLDPNVKKLRQMNLESLFGKTAFDELVCLGTGAAKDDALAPYKDSGLYWIEDLPKNCDLGIKLGLKGILMDHPYNKELNDPRIQRAHNWKEIYEIIINE